MRMTEKEEKRAMRLIARARAGDCLAVMEYLTRYRPEEFGAGASIVAELKNEQRANRGKTKIKNTEGAIYGKR